MTRRQIRSYFAGQLVKCGEVDCYWSRGRLITRSVYVRLVSVPKGAHFVGRYAHPFDASEFMADLDDILAKIRRPRASGSPAVAR